MTQIVDSVDKHELLDRLVDLDWQINSTRKDLQYLQLQMDEACILYRRSLGHVNSDDEKFLAEIRDSLKKIEDN